MRTPLRRIPPRRDAKTSFTGQRAATKKRSFIRFNRSLRHPQDTKSQKSDCFCLKHLWISTDCNQEALNHKPVGIFFPSLLFFNVKEVFAPRGHDYGGRGENKSS